MKKAFRWIMSPIGAIAAIFLGHLIGMWAAGTGPRFTGEIDLWYIICIQVITPIIEGAAFVVAGTLIAPVDDKRVTSIVYSIIGAVAVVGLTIWSLQMGYEYSSTQLLGMFCTFAGTILGPFALKLL